MVMIDKDLKNKKSKDPLVSVVIPTFSTKRFDMTIDCINSIFNNTYKNYEIILTVDGNEKLKQKMEDKFKGVTKVRIIGEKNDNGPSIVRNRCVEIANGDIIAFIDDDAVAPTNWLSCIVKNFSDYQDVTIVGGKLLPIYNGVSGKLPEELLWIVGCTYKGHTDNKQIVRNVISANMAVKRDVFGEVSFGSVHDNKRRFFTPIKQLEDTLFCVNVNNKRNGTILYDPDIIVGHNVSVERLGIRYIIKRSFSEGILKAQLKNENDRCNKNKTNGNCANKNDIGILSHEQNYLGILFNSIIKNLYTFKIRDCLLLCVVVTSAATGYMSEMIPYTIGKIEERIQ